jgi:RNA polymerase sigma factor (TIGR02999 family)
MAVTPTVADEMVTDLLRRWDEQRDPEALNAALPHLLFRLRQLARHYLAHEPRELTLESTALVNEAYLRLLESRVGKIEHRSQFFAFTARLMRQILVDHARGRQRAKRGGGLARTELADAAEVADRRGLEPEKVLAVHEAMEKLERIDPRQRQVVELRYFVGLSVEEVSQALEVSVATVERAWSAARRWLAREIRHAAPPN